MELIMIIMTVMMMVSRVEGLRLACATRGAAIIFPDTELNQIICDCDQNEGTTFGFERFSDIFSSRIDYFASTRPSRQKISNIVLRRCQDVRIDLDLDNLRQDVVNLEDLSFIEFKSLKIKLNNINSVRSVRMVFTNILNTEFSGSITNTVPDLRMYFRELRTGRAAVTFNNVNIEASIKLINLQDIAHFTVADSYFRAVEEFEVVNRQSSVRTRCHDTVDNNFYRPETDCSRELFSDNYRSTTVDPSSSALTSPVTSRPEFIVPVVLLVLVIVGGAVGAGVYYKYNKSHFRMEKL